MDYKQFEDLVKQGIDAIDERFLQKLKNVEIVIEDNPTPYQLEKLNLRGGLLFGLYEGIPQTKREQYGQVLPDKITIFKNPMEQVFSNPEDIKKAVKDTVWHEIAHHFGMDERQVRKAEQTRHKK
ncbi:MAG: hypothetical protein A2812_03030 [Candidatus Staskawiczbacteria bacterium RIFCSPHIGHO2_01_FULL_36_16]|uniref:Metallopeptidase family protein n=1 Tax=Candidatus Staskawiczbacteria bacterium RIFCSPHIGHO2_01_FULL_36_16 TaxID=1802200 RepID=A0A1G2HL14_9BACT|nr:MAG: hypothetical protein A2812_03030 [Candidatus Staskawiczbacteria bacterium RIFCSPHIGHO2_01_FULL_36_16]